MLCFSSFFVLSFKFIFFHSFTLYLSVFISSLCLTKKYVSICLSLCFDNVSESETNLSFITFYQVRLVCGFEGSVALNQIEIVFYYCFRHFFPVLILIPFSLSRFLSLFVKTRNSLIKRPS